MSSDSNSNSTVLAKFTYEGQPGPLQFCDSEEDLVTPVGEFTSLTTLSTSKVIYEGGVSETKYRLRLKEDDLGLATELTRGRAFPIVTARVWEYSKSENSTQLISLFIGEIYIGRRNADGRSGLFEFEVRSDKEKLNIASGIAVYEECDSTFGSIHSCKFDSEPLRITRFVDLIEGVVITLDFDLPIEDRLWPRGYVEVNRLKILILDWDGANKLRLASRPPITWIGQKMIVAPGCDQKAGTCGEIYNNISEIAAYGIGVVDYNPIFENPK